MKRKIMYVLFLSLLATACGDGGFKIDQNDEYSDLPGQVTQMGKKVLDTIFPSAYAAENSECISAKTAESVSYVELWATVDGVSSKICDVDMDSNKKFNFKVNYELLGDAVLKVVVIDEADTDQHNKALTILPSEAKANGSLDISASTTVTAAVVEKALATQQLAGEKDMVTAKASIEKVYNAEKIYTVLSSIIDPKTLGTLTDLKKSSLMNTIFAPSFSTLLYTLVNDSIVNKTADFSKAADIQVVEAYQSYNCLFDTTNFTDATFLSGCRNNLATIDGAYVFSNELSTIYNSIYAAYADFVAAKTFDDAKIKYEIFFKQILAYQSDEKLSLAVNQAVFPNYSLLNLYAIAKNMYKEFLGGMKSLSESKYQASLVAYMSVFKADMEVTKLTDAKFLSYHMNAIFDRALDQRFAVDISANFLAYYGNESVKSVTAWEKDFLGSNDAYMKMYNQITSMYPNFYSEMTGVTERSQIVNLKSYNYLKVYQGILKVSLNNNDKSRIHQVAARFNLLTSLITGAKSMMELYVTINQFNEEYNFVVGDAIILKADKTAATLVYTDLYGAMNSVSELISSVKDPSEVSASKQLAALQEQSKALNSYAASL